LRNRKNEIGATWSETWPSRKPHGEPMVHKRTGFDGAVNLGGVLSLMRLHAGKRLPI
jgi:hypothetical protein